jgi:hypothetical protein
VSLTPEFDQAGCDYAVEAAGLGVTGITAQSEDKHQTFSGEKRRKTGQAWDLEVLRPG